MSSSSIHTPAFDLTAEEQTELKLTLYAHLQSISDILQTRPQPLSIYDLSEALREVRDALLLAHDIHEWDDDVKLSTLLLHKGDCLRGLGRPLEADAAYTTATEVTAVTVADQHAAAQAADRLRATRAEIAELTRSKRMGGLWSLQHLKLGGHGGASSDANLSVLGHETELWDPEPALVVRDAGLRPRLVQKRTSEKSWSLKTGPGGWAAEMVPILRSKKGQQLG